ncbi:uncharacterized protein [Setaria viridis]|uniref:uncharacterized protein n=1 Tax=Setaria viridis TaxID=4556 RepID=UPI0014938551|nr:uncharacterized protein LOC117853270 [Setaria viridis]
MDAYCVEICKLEAHFSGLEFHHVSRDHNVAVDVLSKLGSKRAQVPTGVFVQDLRKPSIKILDPDQAGDVSAHAPTDLKSAEIMMVEAEKDWCTPFIALITDQMALEDKAEHEKLAQRSANYVVIGKELYKKAASTRILMKCILHSEGIKILHEIHLGTCGTHAASGTLVSKAFRSSFYRNTAIANAKELVQQCKGCQFFSKQQHLPA